MWRLISAAVRASTSSKSSEAFTSSPISASVANTSAEISAPPFNAVAAVSPSVEFMKSNHYSRRPDQDSPKLRASSEFNGNSHVGQHSSDQKDLYESLFMHAQFCSWLS